MMFISKLVEVLKELHIWQYEILLYIIVELIKKT